jgi:para-aminobenzoate synthetase/4-amino-4-deoxychorismate lyase
VPRRVRLLVDACGTPTVSVHPLDLTPQPYRVALAPGPSPVLDSPWVRHKTTRRHIYEQARAAALARYPGIQDVLLRNDRGELTESTIANLVVDLNGTLVTPAEHCGLLPGVFRQHLLAGGEVVEGILRPTDLRAARAVYLVNSLRRRWPITVIDS